MKQSRHMRWTEDKLRLLAELYPDHFAKEIADLLGCSDKAVYCQAIKLGLKANPDHASRAGRVGAQHPKSVATRFKKGHTPPNKGKKVSSDTYAKCAPTMFKKGNSPHNHKPVGTEILRGDGYIWVKVAEPAKWKQKQRVVWEREFGEIPPGHNVQMKNHDPLDCRIENLYLISRADQMRNENSLIASYPKPLADIIRFKGVVNRQIHKQERKLNNGKQ